MQLNSSSCMNSAVLETTQSLAEIKWCWSTTVTGKNAAHHLIPGEDMARSPAGSHRGRLEKNPLQGPRHGR